MSFLRTERRNRRGHAVLEVALMAPWIFFLFAGAVDMGFYGYALISTQNAARVAAQYTAKVSGKLDDGAGACQYALVEMTGLPNTNGLTACDALPLRVTATAVKDFDNSDATSVSVTYQTNMLIPIPGLPGRLTVTRIVQMRAL